MRYASRIASSVVVASSMLMASANALGQQFQFQNPHPVDVKPLTEDQEREQLRANIDNWRVYLDSRAQYINGTLDDYNMKKSLMEQARYNAHQAWLRATKAIKKHERNVYRWANEINPTCIDGNVYRDCFCDQGKWGKASAWFGWSNDQKNKDNLIIENDGKYNIYLKRKKQFDDFAAYRAGLLKKHNEQRAYQQQLIDYYNSKYSHTHIQ